MLRHWSQFVPNNVNQHPRTWSSTSSSPSQHAAGLPLTFLLTLTLTTETLSTFPSRTVRDWNELPPGAAQSQALPWHPHLENVIKPASLRHGKDLPLPPCCCCYSCCCCCSCSSSSSLAKSDSNSPPRHY